ncbi:MAG: type II toxin-antitoxin system VapC family toxin [Chthoniobacterales bacterium]
MWGVEVLGLEIEHCHRISVLPFYHKDPFDRMLIAQAMEEGLKIVSVDKVFRKYAVKVVS